MSTHKNYSAIIPSKNEHDSLKITIPFLIQVSQLVGEIIIVVDSRNDSSLIVKKNFEGLRVPVRYIINTTPGVFGAIHTGVINAKHKYIIIATADELYPILRFDDMAKCLIANTAFVSGTRYAKAKGGARYGGNFAGKTFSILLSTLLKYRYKKIISDFTTGFKGFNKDYWAIISKNADGPGWSCVLKFVLNAIKADISIKEIPIISLDRKF
jgi:glycosyltransferase involved in cell wall biosynthesis